MKTSDILQRARALIEDERNWCTGQYFKGKRMCAVGAIQRAHVSAVDYLHPVLATLDNVTTSVCDSATSRVHDVNDKYGHVAVMELYDIAISAAMSDEAGE